MARLSLALHRHARPVTSGELQIFPGAKHINPQYSPDGRQLYFVSDRDGFSDIYRLDLASSEVFQVTRLRRASAASRRRHPPSAWRVRPGRLVFSVFDNGGNLIRALSAEEAHGTPLQAVAVPPGAATRPDSAARRDTAARPDTARPNVTARADTALRPEAAQADGAAQHVRPPAGVLVPVDAASTSIVEAYLADATTGLQQQPVTHDSSYNPKLQLAYLGAPTVGIGVSNQATGTGSPAPCLPGSRTCSRRARLVPRWLPKERSRTLAARSITRA